LRSHDRGGFSLLEILLVIAALILLAAFLLPALGNAREAALTVQCAARLRDIGHAFFAYASDNDGHMVTTSGSQRSSYNWVFWQSDRDINQSALAPYLAERDDRLRAQFCCPATPRENQIGFRGGAPYPLTFSMNAFLAFYPAMTYPRVKDPGHKILVYDENENADDDVFWYLTPRDTIAGRHGNRSAQNVDINDNGTTLAVRKLGNGLFFDGHVELVDNDMCHLPQWSDPAYPGATPPAMPSN
jgi:prepilin-type processing-associated H-X9-DG protein